MDISTGLAPTCTIQRIFTAEPVPPIALGLLTDLFLVRDTAMSPVGLTFEFTGNGLVFDLAPGSDALPQGLALSQTGVLSGTPTADGVVNILLRATNPHGSAVSGFVLTVQEMLFDFTVTLDGLMANPTFGPCAETGRMVTVQADDFSAAAPATIAYQWKTQESGAIPGATGPSYTPQSSLFDGETLFCTVQPEGYPAKDTAGAVIRRVPPAVLGAPSEQFWDAGTGDQLIDMSPFASGEGLIWSVAAQGSTINAATGALSVRTESQAIGATAIVRATNSGGTAEISFMFHIEDIALGPGPDLGTPILDDVTDAIGLTVDEASTIYWRRDPLGTNPDPTDVILGGGYDSGSVVAGVGATNAGIVFSTGNDGLQEISFLSVDAQGEPSLVRTAIIEIDTQPPGLSISQPVSGASGVDVAVTPVLTFNKDVMAGTGLITLYDVTSGSALMSADVVADAGTAPGQVQISGQTVTIYPPALLASNRTYALLIDSEAIRDQAGNPFPGINTISELSFSIVAAAFLETTFGSDFPTALSDVWTSMQVNPFNATPEHRPGETWDAYPATLSNGGIVAVKSGNYPQLRFAVTVEIDKTYSIDADFPIGEGTWAGPLRLKVGSALNDNGYGQIDEPEVGQPRVFELRNLQITATTTELWFALIVETNGGGANGGYPAISMLRIEEV